MLRIAKFDRYDLVNSPMGDKPAFTIWFSGCTLRCEGCQNPQLWDRDFGELFTVSDIVNIIDLQATRFGIEDVVLLGGEPLDQNIYDMNGLCEQLSSRRYNIWLYTGYEFDEIRPSVKNHCYTIKAGRYIDELRDEAHFPITSNQKVFRKIAGVWKQISIGGNE